MTRPWKISVEGTSRTTVLSRAGIPIARFYADRFTPSMLEMIERALNDTEQREVDKSAGNLAS